MKTKTTRRVAMCLMAHPDDCEILAAGTLILLKERGWEIHIVSMSPGDCGSATLGPEAIAQVRRREGAAAAAVMGATYHCIESRDFIMSYDEHTLRKAVALTRQIAPSLMFTHSLDDYMMDHEVTARVARGVSFCYAAPNAAPGPVPAGACVPYLYYADSLEGIDVYGKPIPPGTYIDITAAMATKSRMLKKHASQRDWLLKHHGMDQYITAMQQWCGKRGGEVGVRYAEAFRQHKGHPYPHDCVLTRELGRKVQWAGGTN